MTFDEIILHDFGVYLGENKIRLTPKPDRPIILFGGLNGTGKTTILDALQLCLFGPTAQCSGRNSSGYHDYLAQSIHLQSRFRQAAVGLVFRRFVEGKERRYRVTRSWKISVGKIRESLEVTIDKIPSPTIARNWQEHVSQIIPAKIAHLFFFDGEKVALYASLEGARNLVQTAIHNLLGMDIVEQACRDLMILERRRRSEKIRKADRDSIAVIERKIKEMEKKMSELTEESAKIQSQIIDRGRHKLLNLDQTYRERGGALLDSREKIERSLRRIKKCLASVNERMLIMSEGRLPLLLLSELLQWIGQRADMEEKSMRARLLANILEARDKEMFRQIPENKAGQKIAAALEQFSVIDIQQRREDAKTDILLNLDQNSTSTIIDLCSVEKNRFATNLYELMAQYQKWRLMLDSAQNEYEGIPKEDVLAEITQERNSLEKEISRAEAHVSMLHEQRREMEKNRSKLAQEIAEIEEKNAIIELEHDDLARFLAHSKNARTIMAKFKCEIVRRHINRIEELVLSSYQLLLRKRSLIGKLKIDPETFCLALWDTRYRPLLPEQLSKGEQQLLAISLLWGLARASGKALPIAIDTPLGRLDSSHRLHLVDHYFGCASHQALLFSTDEEINGDYLQKLRKRIGRSYVLSYDDATGSTQVCEGYLGK